MSSWIHQLHERKFMMNSTNQPTNQHKTRMKPPYGGGEECRRETGGRERAGADPSAQGEVGEGSQRRPRWLASRAPAGGGGDWEECRVLGDPRAEGKVGEGSPSRPRGRACRSLADGGGDKPGRGGRRGRGGQGRGGQGG